MKNPSETPDDEYEYEPPLDPIGERFTDADWLADEDERAATDAQRALEREDWDYDMEM